MHMKARILFLLITMTGYFIENYFQPYDRRAGWILLSQQGYLYNFFYHFIQLFVY